MPIRLLSLPTKDIQFTLNWMSFGDFKMKNYEACETEKNSVAYEVPGDKIDGGMICGNSNFEIDEGINSSANFAILDIGTGLSYSTGIKIQPESVKIHVLDYGFEYDNDGFALEIQMVVK
ncbi:hypothetical protein L3Y34_009869 [Caenorhabditis briggsae]|uniref:Uncharacterized protein n=1 Tax=Caenorhabditis briggsae TaxID=6238 RepID=A0AAE9AD48_CAEBR|nr:hypothetical protein L3Y34_009869 [Caenorhabditis briggsae]